MALVVEELLEIVAAREVAVSPWGTSVAFCLSAVEGDREVSRIHVVSLDSEEHELAEPFEGRAPTWSADGSTVSAGDRVEALTAIGPTATIEIRDGEGEPRTLATGCAYAICPSWSPDASRIAFVGTAEPRVGLGDPGLRAWVVDAAGGVAEPVGPEGVVLEPGPVGPTWSADGGALYLRLARSGAIDLVRVDLASEEVTGLVTGRQVVDFSIGGGVLACTVIAPDDPGSIEVVGRGRLEASVGEWTRRRAAEVPARTHRIFRRADGRELDGWVAGVDPVRAPQPTLLCFHGGPHGFFGPGFQRGHFYRDVLASRGWVVLTLNATGSGSYGSEFADDLRGVWGERDLPEHLAALNQLLEAGIADPARLAVAGYSYGGYLAAWAIGQDERFAAAVIGAPIVDLESFERTSDIGSWYTPWQMKGGLPENLDRYRRLSPATHAAAVTTPALILHGEADRRVPFAQGELLRDRLAGGAAVELVAYPGADHLFYSSGGPTERLDFNRRVVDWLEAKVDGGGARG